jgi:transposase
VRLKNTKDRRTAQKLLVILNATVDPRPAEEIAPHTGVSIHSVHNWIPAYNRSGLEGILGPGTGGRRNAHMTREEERLFLEPYFERAVEHVWERLREKATPNKAFKSLDQLQDALCHHLRALENAPEKLRSMTNFPYLRVTC